MRELQAVAASFKTTLRAVYHPRVQYPARHDGRNRRAGTRRDSGPQLTSQAETIPNTKDTKNTKPCRRRQHFDSFVHFVLASSGTATKFPARRVDSSYYLRWRRPHGRHSPVRTQRANRHDHL